MARIDWQRITPSNATGYPPPHDAAVAGRWWRRLAPVAGLTALGASHVTLEPGAWSSQRHWHAAEDELVVMLSGEAVLVEDAGETIVRPGDVLAWPMGSTNGHHLINRTDAPATFIAVSAGFRAGGGAYSDIDMAFTADGYVHKDGTPYPSGRIA